MENILPYFAVAAAAVLIFSLPRQSAAGAFFLGVLLIPRGAQFTIEGFRFYPIRVLVLVGLLRILMRDERNLRPAPNMDFAAILVSCSALLTSLLHSDPAGTFVNRAAYCLDWTGGYFVLRLLLPSPASIASLHRAICFMLVLLGGCMLYEQLSGWNVFSLIGGRPDIAARAGRLRASGPFSHSILAGTVAAISLSSTFVIWRLYPKLAKAGAAGAFAAVVASHSSGPIMTLFFVLAFTSLWRWRRFMKRICWASLAVMLLLVFVMNRPIWYLMAYIDFIGGSTGYHRARLIDAGIEHIGEWWLFGTDATRHWMPTGVSWSEYHVDVTNYYLAMGVLGGLPLLFAFVFLIFSAFRKLKTSWPPTPEESLAQQFHLWCLGAGLVSSCVTMVSVAYFDQSSFLCFGGLALLASASSVSGVEWNLLFKRRLITDDENENVLAYEYS